MEKGIVVTFKYVLLGIFVLSLVCGLTLKWYFARERIWIRAKLQKPVDETERLKLDSLVVEHKRIAGAFILFGLFGLFGSTGEKWLWSPLFGALVVAIMLVATKRL